MIDTATTGFTNPLFLRHDLMIELGRLEMAIEGVREQGSTRDMLDRLESRQAKINEALNKLPA